MNGKEVHKWKEVIRICLAQILESQRPYIMPQVKSPLFRFRDIFFGI